MATYGGFITSTGADSKHCLYCFGEGRKKANQLSWKRRTRAQNGRSKPEVLSKLERIKSSTTPRKFPASCGEQRILILWTRDDISHLTVTPCNRRWPWSFLEWCLRVAFYLVADSRHRGKRRWDDNYNVHVTVAHNGVQLVKTSSLDDHNTYCHATWHNEHPSTASNSACQPHRHKQKGSLAWLANDEIRLVFISLPVNLLLKTTPQANRHGHVHYFFPQYFSVGFHRVFEVKWQKEDKHQPNIHLPFASVGQPQPILHCKKTMTLVKSSPFSLTKIEELTAGSDEKAQYNLDGIWDQSKAPPICTRTLLGKGKGHDLV